MGEDATRNDSEEGFGQLVQTMGTVAPSLRAMKKFAPDYFDTYMQMREIIYRTPPNAALDLKTKELIYVILDIASDNLPGAENHMRAGLRAGLTTAELVEACMQVIHVFGIGKWGKTGHKVCELAESIEKGNAPA